jgi:hypothetical protein
MDENNSSTSARCGCYGPKIMRNSFSRQIHPSSSESFKTQYYLSGREKGWCGQHRES